MNREAERKRLVELIENFFEEEIGASFVKGFLDIARISNQNDKHHTKLVDHSDENGAENENKDAVVTHPFIAVIGSFHPKEHQTAGGNRRNREKNVKELENFFQEQNLEIEKIVKERKKGIGQLFALRFRNDKNGS